MSNMEKIQLADIINRLLLDFGMVPEVKRQGDGFVINYLNVEYARKSSSLHSLLANYYNQLADERDARKVQALREVAGQPNDEAVNQGGVR